MQFGGGEGYVAPLHHCGILPPLMGRGGRVTEAAVLAHCFCFSMVAGRGTNTFRIHMALIFSAECKHSAMVQCPAALEERKQQCGLDFPRLARH